MKCALAVAVLLATGAHADDKLGFRIGLGRLAMRDTVVRTSHLGLAVEHSLGATRVLGEYEWMWIVNNPDHQQMEGPRTSGHRAHLGVRRQLARKRILYLDVEGGVGLGIYDLEVDTRVVAHAFTGLRCGYSLTAFDDEPRDADLFEVETSVRLLVIEHGHGLYVNFGFYWGD